MKAPVGRCGASQFPHRLTQVLLTFVTFAVARNESYLVSTSKEEMVSDDYAACANEALRAK